MKLEKLIYDETLKWVKETIPCIEKYNGNLCVRLEDLSQWIDDSGKKKNRLIGILKDSPSYGVCEEGLIYIKYLPYLLCRFDVHRVTNLEERERIQGFLERIGFMIPKTPPHKFYFVEFYAKEDKKRYIKIGYTTTSMKTRLRSIRQQFRPLAVNGSIKIVGIIKKMMNDITIVEKQIKERLTSFRVTQFETGTMVGKTEIYNLSSECIDGLIEEFCETRIK